MLLKNYPSWIVNYLLNRLSTEVSSALINTSQTLVLTSCSRFLNSPTITHWQACKRVLHYLKGTSDIGIHFKHASKLALKNLADADWVGCVDDRRSTLELNIFLGGNLRNWNSKI